MHKREKERGREGEIKSIDSHVLRAKLSLFVCLSVCLALLKQTAKYVEQKRKYFFSLIINKIFKFLDSLEIFFLSQHFWKFSLTPHGFS